MERQSGMNLSLFSLLFAALTHSQYFSARRHEGILTSILGQKMRSVGEAALPPPPRVYQAAGPTSAYRPSLVISLSAPCSIFLHVNQEIAFRAIEAAYF